MKYVIVGDDFNDNGGKKSSIIKSLVFEENTILFNQFVKI